MAGRARIIFAISVAALSVVCILWSYIVNRRELPNFTADGTTVLNKDTSPHLRRLKRGAAGADTVKGWGPWDNWLDCSVTCGVGVRRQIRYCLSQPCEGIRVNEAICAMRPCGAVVYCTFNTVCEDVIIHEDDMNRYRWRRLKGPTSSADTGPKNENDTYIYVDASFGVKGEIATFKTKDIISSSDHYCLFFKYHMHGEGKSRLNVLLINYVGQNKTITMLNIDKDRWFSARFSVGVSTGERFRIDFQAQHGVGHKADIALDDITLYEGRCEATWTDWTDDPCSATCGTGLFKRRRECKNGTSCQVPSEVTETCSMEPCPSGWSPWGKWSACMVTEDCGSGRRLRDRICKHGENNEENICNGSAIEEKMCDPGKCIKNALLNCDFENECHYFEKRNGTYIWDRHNGSTNNEGTGPDVDYNNTKEGIYMLADASVGNEGDKAELKTRVLIPTAPKYCLEFYYHMYGDHITFLAVLHQADKLSPRVIFNSKGNQTTKWIKKYIQIETTPNMKINLTFLTEKGKGTKGDVAIDEIKILRGQCNPEWGMWGPWKCPCVDSRQIRERQCAENSTCQGQERELRNCTSDRCPGWGPWGPCSVTCGDGVTSRTRPCPNGTDCVEGLIDTEKCIRSKCITPNKTRCTPWSDCTTRFKCEIGSRERKCGNDMKTSICRGETACPPCGPWSNYLPCDVTCGKGRQSRARYGKCPPPGNTESKTCSRPICCGLWSSWGSCSVTCGHGVESRNRTGDCLPPGNTEDRTCSGPICCGLWGSWSDCSVTCGLGVESRNRKGDCPPPGNTESRTCSGPICCGLWGSWRDCSVTCGLGVESRNRKGDCPPPGNTERRTCSGPICCDMWGSWSDCSETCGLGVESRNRKGDCPPPGNTESRTCSRPICCGLWGSWSSCSVTCGHGVKSRNRKGDCPPPGNTESKTCSNGSCCVWTAWSNWVCPCDSSQQTRTRLSSGLGCNQSESMSSRHCNDTTCFDWAPWSICSATCGMGIKRRTRSCPSGTICNYHLRETRRCKMETCSFWGPWSSWVCPCTTDPQTRSRRCFGRGCIGETLEIGSCARLRCPEWSAWGQCFATCGLTGQMRTRKCPVGVICLYPSRQSRLCNNPACPAWLPWGPWNCPCSTGKHMRTRQCSGSLCPEGDKIEERSCTATECPEWTTWTSCSYTCGAGIQTRRRLCIPGTLCYYPPSDMRSCNLQACPVWNTWTPWTCPCNGGMQQRTRRCSLRSGCSGSNIQSRNCLNNCPAWAEWTLCSVTCGRGRRQRRRTCQQGTTCYYSLFQSEMCNKPLCGAWKPWGNWICPCRNGEHQRYRECQGIGCIGEASDSKPCVGCPAWTAWNQCRPTCGAGSRTRRRNCPTGISCLYPLNEYQMCNAKHCPVWSAWGSWRCPCEKGQQRRTRRCNQEFCPGSSINQRICSDAVCPGWEQWTSCNPSCGSGSMIRRRTCIAGTICLYPLRESKSCKVVDCPEWGVWDGWECPCAGGRQSRTRTCRSGTCLGVARDERSCVQNRCPAWEPWGECTSTCGEGRRERIRTCVRGTVCMQPLREVQACSLPICPVWTQWGPWICPCEKGLQTKHRRCFEGQCIGNTRNTRVCSTSYCPEWLSWAPCSATCGNGRRHRKRMCPENTVCRYHMLEIGYCNVGECRGAKRENRCRENEGCMTDVLFIAENITTNIWEPWGRCTRTCGVGVQTRVCYNTTKTCNGEKSRSCLLKDCEGYWTEWNEWTACLGKHPKCTRWQQRTCSGVYCIGSYNKMENCSCPDTVNEWSEWSKCSVTCYTGQITRTRRCISGSCEGFSLNESKSCVIDTPCPGTWNAWGKWSNCSQPCAEGVRQRFRTCRAPNCPNENKTEGCNPEPCPEKWRPWLPWGECELRGESPNEKECEGFRIRNRSCTFLNCSTGENIDRRICTRQNDSCIGQWLAWSSWTCPVSCGSGQKIRYRKCSNGDGTCKGSLYDTGLCYKPCPGEWTHWRTGGCPVSCGNGTQFYIRDCLGGNCIGENSRTSPCFEKNCTGLWSSWINGSCSVTCGSGVQNRTRSCSGGICLHGKSVSVISCEEQPCGGIWDSWTTWMCDVTCGKGVAVRRRRCKTRSCDGDREEEKLCNGEKPCPGYWSQWSPCNGTGVEERTQICPGKEDCERKKEFRNCSSIF